MQTTLLKPDYLETFDVPLYDSIIQRGLSSGIGHRGGQMCIEAAICTVLGLPHSDEPECVVLRELNSPGCVLLANPSTGENNA